MLPRMCCQQKKQEQKRGCTASIDYTPMNRLFSSLIKPSYHLVAKAYRSSSRCLRTHLVVAWAGVSEGRNLHEKISKQLDYHLGRGHTQGCVLCARGVGGGEKVEYHLWWNIMGHADCPFSNCCRVRGSSFGTAYGVGLKEYLSSIVLRLGSSSA